VAYISKKVEEILQNVELVAEEMANDSSAPRSVKYIAEQAGYDGPKVYRAINTLRENNAMEGIARLKVAFDKAGITSRMLDDLYGNIASAAPPAPPKQEVVVIENPAKKQAQEVDALVAVINALKDIDEPRQKHIIHCARMFFGITTT